MAYNRLNEIEAIGQALSGLAERMECDLGDMPYSRIAEYIDGTRDMASSILSEVRQLREEMAVPPIAALEPEAPPAPQHAPDEPYTGEFGDEPGAQHGVDEADKPEEPEQMVVDAAEFGGIISQPADQSEESGGAIEASDAGPSALVSSPGEGEESRDQLTAEDLSLVLADEEDSLEHYDEYADEGETHTDGVRNNGDETGAVASEQTPQSITQDPELIAAVERAEAALDRDRIVTRYADEWAQPNAPDVLEPTGYVGHQNADLDAEFEAMKAREAKAKPRFSIWGGRKLEDA